MTPEQMARRRGAASRRVRRRVGLAMRSWRPRGSVPVLVWLGFVAMGVVGQ